jgi:hypothetical protein
MWIGNATATLQLIATPIGIIGALIAAFKGIAELRAGRLQRERDLRWRQADAASRLLDKAMQNPRIQAAQLLLDSSYRQLEITRGEFQAVPESKVLHSLQALGKPTDATEAFVRECLDELLLFYATLEHYIDAALVRFDDVEFPADYYARAIARYKPFVGRYCRDYGHERALSFLNRFPAWVNAASAA